MANIKTQSSRSPLLPDRKKLRYCHSLETPETRFTMREEYTGPLPGMVFKMIPDLAP